LQEITSPQNPRLKNAAKLRTRRGREKQNRIIIDGFREVGHAIDASTEITELFGCMSILNKEKRQRFEELAQRAKTEVFNVDTHVFNKLAFGDRAEGVVAVARKPNASLDQLNLPDSPLIGVIESIEKPGNVGAVIRSADGAGLDAVIVVSGGTDLYNPNAIRASLGGIFSMNVADASAQETILWLEQNNIKITCRHGLMEHKVTRRSISNNRRRLCWEARLTDCLPNGIDPVSLPLHCRCMASSIVSTSPLRLQSSSTKLVDNEVDQRRTRHPACLEPNRGVPIDGAQQARCLSYLGSVLLGVLAVGE